MNRDAIACFKCKYRDSGAAGCDNYEQRIELLQKVVDSQATVDERMAFNKMVSECENCFCKIYCQQQLEIKQLLRTHLDRKRVPIDIIEEIKKRLSKQA